MANVIASNGNVTAVGVVTGGQLTTTTPTMVTFTGSGLTQSTLQGFLDEKQATLTGAATTIASSNLTTSRALVSNSSGKVAVSAVTATELGYIDGVTSNVQTQLNNKQATLPTSGTASTTYAINVTGNAATATKATSATSATTATSAATATKVGCAITLTNDGTTSLATFDGSVAQTIQAGTNVTFATCNNVTTISATGGGGCYVDTSTESLVCVTAHVDASTESLVL